MSNYKLHLSEEKASEVFGEVLGLMSDYDVGTSEEMMETVPPFIIVETMGRMVDIVGPYYAEYEGD